MSGSTFLTARAWLEGGGLRLDASAYAGGGLRARDRIMSGPWEWHPLGEVADVWLPNRFTRRYVADPEHGVPLLSSSDMLLADLRGLGLLSRATLGLSTLSAPLRSTLVSRSGTIGRTAYVRSEMAGLPISEHALRVAAHGETAPAGYIYAFLSSMPAQAMIRQRTFGSVVQHIEPSDLSGLPVPIIPEPARGRVDQLVVAAGHARSEAGRLLDIASGWYDRQAPVRRYVAEHARAVSVVPSATVGLRLDAFNHVGWAAESVLEGERLDAHARIVATARVPRVYVERGVPFMSGIDVFHMRPSVRVRLARHVAQSFDALVHAGELAVQGSGQRYGLLGRAAYIGQYLDGWAASHDLFRIVANDPARAASLYAFLRSDVGHRAMLRHSYGTSIPHVNPTGIASIKVPETPADVSTMAARALALREQADADEGSAISEVERWLG